MATVTKGREFVSGETVTPAKLNTLVDSATIANVVDADVSASAAIALSKLATGALPTAITVASANIVSSAVTQAKLASNVAGTGPVFRARLGSAQTIANGGTAKLNLDTEFFDEGGFWNTSTYQFQPTVAGYYQISVAAYASAGATELAAMIYKNGSEYSRGSSSNASSGRVSSISDVVYLNGSTDYVDARAFHQNGTGASATLDAGARTFISGSLIRAV